MTCISLTANRWQAERQIGRFYLQGLHFCQQGAMLCSHFTGIHTISRTNILYFLFHLILIPSSQVGNYYHPTGSEYYVCQTVTQRHLVNYQHTVNLCIRYAKQQIDFIQVKKDDYERERGEEIPLDSLGTGYHVCTLFSVGKSSVWTICSYTDQRGFKKKKNSDCLKTLKIGCEEYVTGCLCIIWSTDSQSAFPSQVGHIFTISGIRVSQLRHFGQDSHNRVAGFSLSLSHLHISHNITLSHLHISHLHIRCRRRRKTKTL